jgi:hypothetical protein
MLCQRQPRIGHRDLFDELLGDRVEPRPTLWSYKRAEDKLSFSGGSQSVLMITTDFAHNLVEVVHTPSVWWAVTLTALILFPQACHFP